MQSASSSKTRASAALKLEQGSRKLEKVPSESERVDLLKTRIVMLRGR